jgi:hypothetical protein
MKYKKIFGGNNILDYNNNKIEKFIAIIIIGYFGIKIIYPLFFNFYPDKYYHRNIQITTNDSKAAHNITLNAYVPGLWNSEITDFITLLVLSYVIYIFTNFSGKSCVDSNGNLTLVFLFGYIVGLGYPAIKTIYLDFLKKKYDNSNLDKKDNYNYYMLSFTYFIYIAFVIGIIILNLIPGGSGSTGGMNYILYVVILALFIFGLISTRKKTNTFTKVSYFYNNGETCGYEKTNNNKNVKNTIVKSSEDEINITLPFIVFITLLLFSNEPSIIGIKEAYIFIYALLLGSLVSYISYYGIEYFLIKKPMRECNTLKECITKKTKKTFDIRDLVEEEDLNIYKILDRNIDPNLKNNIGSSISKYYHKISFIKLTLLISLICIIIYLIYYHLFRRRILLRYFQKII